MSNLDNPGIYYQERFFANDGVPDTGKELIAEYRQLITQFRNFIRDFSTGGFGMIYREQLKRNYHSHDYHLEINLNHLKNFDEDIEMKLRKFPGKVLPALEEAAKIVADEITQPRPKEEEKLHDIQVMLTLDEYPTSLRQVKSAQVSQVVKISGIIVAAAQTLKISLSLPDEHPTSLRQVKSAQVSQVVKISGIIVAAAQVRSKATKVTLQCRQCKHTIPDVSIKPGLEGFSLPRTCAAPQQGQMQRCPIDPYVMLPDKCECVDYQTLKLQENPEDVPHGEMPRHLQLFTERYLTDKVVPGNRVTIVGVYSIKKLAQKKTGDKTLQGIRTPYLRVLGIQIETSGPGRTNFTQFTPEEERMFKSLAQRKDAFELIAKSIAPSIYGSADIKKSIACLLFGGARKRLPDGITRRGDINVLLLGDPGTAKSQLLKFVEQVAPIGVYTSGKGSSAAGLTASVIRDPQSRSFIMEGGAMVLADGGVVCIDEFDKMREDDRVAIHEAMEQQTISIAKAGITTTLNSRCSVLAAANSVYGRWDESRGDDNIDFMPTILSRFDMIYIVKDVHDVQKDSTLAKHVIEVHVNAAAAKERDDSGVPKTLTTDVDGGVMTMYDTDGFLTIEFLKKFVTYARMTCGPRLTPQASEKLVNHYVKMRNPVVTADTFKSGKKAHHSAIPITVRQLEAIVRIAESLAKMELQHFATDKHVEEALRLFRVSTIEAAATGNLAGVEGFTSNADQEALNRIEVQMKKRFAIGTHVSEHLIISDFVSRQHYKESLVKKVIDNLVRRGDIQQKMQRKMLYRVR